jgi:hypothetical protein
MATHAASGANAPGGTHTGTAMRTTGRPAVFTGWTKLAGALMFFGGLLHVASGVAALRGDEVFATTGNYAFQNTLNGWGWIHLLLGAVVAVAGIAVLATGAAWARWVGIVLAGFGMIASFLWLPYYQVWAVITLALNVFIMWALCAGMGERTQAPPGAADTSRGRATP